jgi:hypothetical protein
LAKTDLENPRPVPSKSMIIIPGFPSGKFIQPSPFPLAVSYIMSKGFARQRAEPDLKENREHLEGTFYVPSNEAGNTSRFFRDARNALRFPLKPVHNQRL